MNDQLTTRRISRVWLLAICFMFWLTSIAHGAPNPPTDAIVVPRYEATISLIMTWTDNSGDETGFAIERRAQGDTAFSSLATVGVNVTSYQDNTATSDRMWEYRVRALGGPVGDSAWSTTSNASSPKIVWPVADGSRNILNNYGNPLEAAGGGGLYYHDGVDFANNGQINAARGGRLVFVDTSNNGGVEIDVDTGAAGTYRDVYWHLHGPDIGVVLGVNDVIAPGETLATSLHNFGRAPEANHCHWETDLTTGNGKISVLSLYGGNADRDPQNSAPVVADVSNDGQDFIVVDAAANDHTAPRQPAWGDVDFLVDAYDDMSTASALVVSPQSIGYWIQPGVSGAETVRSSGTPYRLIAFDQAPALCGSPCAGELIAENALYNRLPADLHGINTWQSNYTWVVTNTRGTNGDPANIDANQFWRTDARSGSGAEPNGSDAARARENQEARFPDGTYFAHIVLKDFVHTSDHVRSVVVDNSRPYVKKLTVYSGMRIVYQAQWVWDGATAQLALQPATFDAAAAFTALRTQDLTIEVEFSEPMQTASISSITPGPGVTALSAIPTLSSTQPADARTIWRGLISNLDITDDGTQDGAHMLTIEGTDLAGNQLLQINSRTTMGADHHNRDAAGNLRGTAGADAIHGFRIGPLAGVINVTAIFMKQTAADPATPTIADKALALQTALNTYFQEVSYQEISFAVTGYGWYQLAHPLNWYETQPRTPLIDLVQEAVQAAEAAGAPVATSDYVLVVTDETTIRNEWSTNGAWPYAVAAAPGWKLIAAGTQNLASIDAHVTNLMGRMVGLIDLFAYEPEVIMIRPFVGPWSHMSDKENNVHVLGWEKWRTGWVDETGTATGKTVVRVPKPSVASPIVNQDHTLIPLDSNVNGVKMVAVEIGDRLHYTAEYRRQQNLDSALPEAGVVISKVNDDINQGEGPAIIQESNVTAGNLADAPFTTNAPRNTFNDVGSGVNIEVISMNANQAQIRLNYTVPPTENDVYVVRQDDRWKTEDIWIDAPDAAGNFAADGLTVKDSNEKPVVGEVNRVHGRVRNQGHADATNFEVHLEIREPWGAGGPWRRLKVETVPLLQGQDTNPGAYYLISADWTPSGDPHSCVKLSVHGVANDANPENNWTQENFSEFVSTPGSAYGPVTSRFEVENPYDETVTVFFRLDGLPASWSYILTPQRLTIPPRAVGSAQVTIQPHEAAPICSREQITISAYTPRVDTLKRLGAITLQVALKNGVNITTKSWMDCGQPESPTLKALVAERPSRFPCAVYTQGCTEPKLPNTQVAVVYTAPGGTKQVHYVTTDENGCFADMLPVGEPGVWQTQVILEETDCQTGVRTPKTPVYVGPGGICVDRWWCCLLWGLFVAALIAAVVLLALAFSGTIWAGYAASGALGAAVILSLVLLRYCVVGLWWCCLVWMLFAVALVMALAGLVLTFREVIWAKYFFAIAFVAALIYGWLLLTACNAYSLVIVALLALLLIPVILFYGKRRSFKQ